MVPLEHSLVIIFLSLTLLYKAAKFKRLNGFSYIVHCFLGLIWNNRCTLEHELKFDFVFANKNNNIKEKIIKVRKCMNEAGDRRKEIPLGKVNVASSGIFLIVIGRKSKRGQEFRVLGFCDIKLPSLDSYYSGSPRISSECEECGWVQEREKGRANELHQSRVCLLRGVCENACRTTVSPGVDALGWSIANNPGRIVSALEQRNQQWPQNYQNYSSNTYRTFFSMAGFLGWRQVDIPLVQVVIWFGRREHRPSPLYIGE